MDTAIEADALRKSYGSRTVLEGLSLSVPRGTVLGLLGPNGAGKTTAVRMLATLTRSDSGTATVCGFDITRQRAQVRKRISLTGQYAALDDAQTGAENLQMIGALQGLRGPQARQRGHELLERFDLVDAGARRIASYSGGMRRRLDLAASLVGRPEVLFLDEPTTGLDPRSRLALWSVIRELSASGTTVLLTTQYLDEADELADGIAVLDAGRIVAQGTPEELKAAYAQPRLDLSASDDVAFDALAARIGTRALARDRDALSISVRCDGDGAAVRSLLDELDPDRRAVAWFEMHSPTLDDVFLSVTGHAVATAHSEKETVDA